METKTKDLFLFLSFYLIAYTAGFFSVFFTSFPLELKFFLFDIIATLVIWIISLFIHNSSLYDAYWSLTPMVMLIWLWIIMPQVNVYLIIFSTAFFFWSIRLTINWITTFDGRTWEDWRYKNLRETLNPVLWQIANLFGIMIMPTLLVFLGFFPIFKLFESISPLSLVGSTIILIGTLLELFADRDMHSFLKADKVKGVCNIGLWHYSRHPNYLGEILIWVGVYLAFIKSFPELWYYGAGALGMILLFEFISIPMAEKRQKTRRPDYLSYIRSTSRLLVLPPKEEKKLKH